MLTFLCREQKRETRKHCQKPHRGQTPYYTFQHNGYRKIINPVSLRHGEALFPRCPGNASRKKAFGLVIMIIRAVAQSCQAVPFAFFGARAAKNLSHQTLLFHSAALRKQRGATMSASISLLPDVQRAPRFSRGAKTIEVVKYTAASCILFIFG